MKQEHSYEEKCLLALIRCALSAKADAEIQTLFRKTVPDWQRLFEIAKKHEIISLFYDELAENEAVPLQLRRMLTQLSRTTVCQNYRLLFLTSYLTSLFEKKDIAVVVLKGASTSVFYRTPELRKSGDIDLLLPNLSDMEVVDHVLRDAGFSVAKKQHANHHIVYCNSEGISVEIHRTFCEPFDNETMNRYMQERVRDCTAHTMRADVMGVTLPVLDLPYHAYQLLLHMLQHFLRSGFGLKLLCDWVVLWKQAWSEEDMRVYRHLVSESGLCGFSDMIFAVCSEYLGLRQCDTAGIQKELVDDFLQEIIEAEEFGKSSEDRMVVMRGTKMWDYIREFHHQMKLTYPRSSRCVICWPVLWVMTLFGFLYRNRRLRGVSTIKIMQKARSRSRLVEDLRLFKK